MNIFCCCLLLLLSVVVFVGCYCLVLLVVLVGGLHVVVLVGDEAEWSILAQGRGIKRNITISGIKVPVPKLLFCDPLRKHELHRGELPHANRQSRG